MDELEQWLEAGKDRKASVKATRCTGGTAWLWFVVLKDRRSRVVGCAHSREEAVADAVRRYRGANS